MSIQLKMSNKVCGLVSFDYSLSHVCYLLSLSLYYFLAKDNQYQDILIDTVAYRKRFNGKICFCSIVKNNQLCIETIKDGVIIGKGDGRQSREMSG